MIAALRTRQVHPLAVVVLWLQFLDLASTGLVIRLGGAESNWVVEAMGWELAIVAKCAIMLGVGWTSAYAPTPLVVRCLRAVAILYACVVTWNLLLAGALVYR